jgi:dipeptidyl aminopeptidase/acylaminoacyl peptidase
MPEQAKRTMKAEDLYRFGVVMECEISPNGGHVVFCIQRVDRDTEKKYTNLWVVPADGGEPSQFTHGDHVDYKPRWSPDSTRIAFLSSRSDEDQQQLHIIPLKGGEGRQLTNMKGAFDVFEWSPSGEHLVCQFRRKDQNTIEREQDEQKNQLGIVSRRIERVFYKLDGDGFLPQERWHI